jgi:SNF2 family DNA or RNA helicase
MTQELNIVAPESTVPCPFCGNKLPTRFSKCFNIYCEGKEFHKNNLVIYRLNSELGVGRIVKDLNIPSSNSLEEDDTYFITKHKVQFQNNITKIVHPYNLVHYVFQTNDRIETDTGSYIVNSPSPIIRDGRLSYEVLATNGKKTLIYESEINLKDKRVQKEPIFEETLSSPKAFLVKYWAQLFYSYYTSNQIKCITNSRLSLMPHQINVAHRLAEDYFPRMLLADEVGLGKTIEAGIYIKEMISRNLAERILLVVPASLVNQWKFEMENKFNINFTIYDGKKVKKLTKKGSYNHPNLLQNPFYYDNYIICSLQFARNPKYIHMLSQITWDIVVFDEAHHLRRYLLNKSTGNYRETLNYRLARNLSETTESLLLLTATPLQLHSFELYSLIELIHPEAFESFEDFEHFRKNIPFINLLFKNLSKIDKLNTFEVKNTVKLLRDLNYIDKNQSLNKSIESLKNKSKRSQILRRLEKQHTLSKFMVRNRKKNVISEKYINERVVKTITVDPTQEELDLYNEIRLYLAKIYNMAGDVKNKNLGLGFVITTLQKLLTSSKAAFLKSLKRRLLTLESLKKEDPDYFTSEYDEMTIDNEQIGQTEKGENLLSLENQRKILQEFYEKLSAIPYDSKSEALLELLEKVRGNKYDEKVIIFTQFVDTLFFLKKVIKKAYPDFSINLFYGGIDKDEKAEAVKKFRSSNDFSVLLSTQVGGEGRNFQFCRMLINYDLPWNPMKLEQRIGRLDRIGQKSNKIYIYNFFIEGTIETDVIFALNKRIDLFKESIGQLEPILGKIEQDIKDIIFNENTPKFEKINEFNRDVEDKVKKAEEMELQLDDLLIDKKSFQIKSLMNYDAHDQIKLQHNELFKFISEFFSLKNSRYGSITKIKKSSKYPTLNSDFLVKIELSESLKDSINKPLKDQYTGTFDLKLARRMEEVDFFALGHPLIDAIIKYCLTERLKGEFSLLTLNRKPLSEEFRNKLRHHDQLYLFLFKLQFKGYITESRIVPILLDSNKEEHTKLARLILSSDKVDKFFQSQSYKNEDIEGSVESVKNFLPKARQLVKSSNSQWRRDVLKLNDVLFKKERKKKKKLYHYKKKTLNHKLDSLKKKRSNKKRNLPSEKKITRINLLDDKEKRERRLENLKRLKEDITFIEKDIDLAKRKLDNLEFRYEDLKNDMQKRNLRKFSTRFMGAAIINLSNSD